MLWEKLWECQSTPSGELMSDESWSGDFTDNGDLIPLTHQETKMDCQEYSELWADPTSVHVECSGGGAGGTYPGQPTDGLAGRTNQISKKAYFPMSKEDNVSSG